jgi:ABC-2 type transport system permease protein
MNTSSETVAGRPVERHGPPAFSWIRLLEWSVRREIWENRSIYAAPLAVAAVVLFIMVVSTGNVRHWRRVLLLPDPVRQRALLEQPYDIAAMMLFFTVLFVGIFYCLDALHGERRDRSILFWKSLPVSDTTTVISKALVPLLVLPLLSFAIIAAVQTILWLVTSAVLMGSGLGHSAVGPQARVIPSPPALLLAVLVTALWHAPLYGWLLLVSGWAKRAAVLWAFLPFFAASALERGAFHTSFIGSFLRYRFLGWWGEALGPRGEGRVGLQALTRLRPTEFLGTSGMWIGLALAAAFLAAAVRLRRYREPI